jgi:DNA-binding sugar fermentation-stimulating protein
MREDALYFKPFQERDPAFSWTLSQAARAGVESYTYLCKVEQEGLTLGKEISCLQE